MPITDPAQWQAMRDWLGSADSRALRQQVERKIMRSAAQAESVVQEYARFVYLLGLHPQTVTPPPLLAATARLHRTMVSAPFPAAPFNAVDAPPGDAAATAALYAAEFGAPPDPAIWHGPAARRQTRALVAALAGLAALVLLGLVAQFTGLPLPPEVWLTLLALGFGLLLVAAWNQPLRRKWF